MRPMRSEDDSFVSERTVALTPLGEQFDATSFDWQGVRRYGLRNMCVSQSGGSNPSCGKILAHARGRITAFREAMGIRVCVFKIGVTSNPVQRYISYLKLHFTDMWVLTMSSSVDLIHMLEAACISHFSSHVGCRNRAESGGEGALNRRDAMPPFFLYVTGGRADQPRNVG